jgi:flavodoxin I
MVKIAILYASETGNTERIALKISERLLPWYQADLLDVADPGKVSIADYQVLILGVSTWGNGALQDDWEVFSHTLVKLKLDGKTLAFFGLGDQDSYPNTFVDGMGILYQMIRGKSFTLIGSWPTEEYIFTASKALNNGFFIGLVIDEDNQPELTDSRLDNWTKQLMNQFR